MELLNAERWSESVKTRRPLATDNFARGAYRMDRDKALTKTHLQINSPYMVNALTFDHDDDDAARVVLSQAWDDESIPEPSWITTNPHTGHAHIGYLLESPIPTTAAGRRKPVEYAADLERTLTARMGADIRYNGTMTRNPLHKGHVTHWGRAEGYTLGELHKPLGKLDPKPSRVIQPTGLGRNVDLFDKTRGYAYGAWRRHTGFEAFYKDVTAYAVSTNAVSFEGPLARSEAQMVARSVARWTWANFDNETFSKIQKGRSMRRATVKSKAEAVATIRDTAEGGHKMTAAEIMGQFDVSERTARAYLSEAGLAVKTDLDDRTAEVVALKASGLTYGAIMDQMGLTKSQVRHALRRAA